MSLTEQLALLELLVQQRTDLAVLSALVKLLLHLLRSLLVQDVLLLRGLQETAGCNNIIKYYSNSVEIRQETLTRFSITDIWEMFH